MTSRLGTGIDYEAGCPVHAEDIIGFSAADFFRIRSTSLSPRSTADIAVVFHQMPV